MEQSFHQKWLRYVDNRSYFWCGTIALHSEMEVEGDLLTCRSPVSWSMLSVAGLRWRPALAGHSSDGGRGGAPSDRPKPGTHCLECWCWPGQTEVRHWSVIGLVSRTEVLFGRKRHHLTQSMACGVFSLIQRMNCVVFSEMTTAADFAFSKPCSIRGPTTRTHSE